MIREALFKVGGMTLLLIGLLLLVVGFFAMDKFTEATGLMGIVMGIILLYYVWMMEDIKPRDEEPPFNMPVTQPKTGK